MTLAAGTATLPATGTVVSTCTLASGAHATATALLRPNETIWDPGAGPGCLCPAYTITRPSSTTAYTANDALADNATAGSVTPCSWTVGATADKLVGITGGRIKTNDAVLGASGVAYRLWLFSSSPTVAAGDNAAYTNSTTTLVGTMVGTMRATGFGGFGRLTPEDDGSPMYGAPASGTTTLYGLLQILTTTAAVTASTTVTVTLECQQMG
jgi:hypothetical protein